MENVVDAFSANSDLVFGHTILIVDDVCTTGSTLSACANALLEAGARQVYGLTVTTPLGKTSF
jgi:predicted amidophosphoribosyltransferase